MFGGNSFISPRETLVKKNQSKNGTLPHPLCQKYKYKDDTFNGGLSNWRYRSVVSKVWVISTVFIFVLIFGVGGGYLANRFLFFGAFSWISLTLAFDRMSSYFSSHFPVYRRGRRLSSASQSALTGVIALG
jgi:hypothetical protein